MTSSRPRLGFLGVGWIGRRRLEAIVAADVAEIAAIAEPVPELIENCREFAPDLYACGSLDELLAQQLDGLVISTPSALHAQQSIAALDRGVAVFCQKALGRDAREVHEIIESARRADRLLGVDLSYRHVAGMQRIRELIQGGELGEVFAVDLVFHNAYGPDKPWFYDRNLSGGGCVIDLGIHLVDVALWALDASVVSVSSRVFAGGHLLGSRTDVVEDFATARLDLNSGAGVQLACSWRLHAGRMAVIEAAFYGTKGGAAMRNVNGSFRDFKTERFTGTDTVVIGEPPEEWGGRAAVAWVQQLAQRRHFDPEIERQVEVAVALDAIYGRESARALLSADVNAPIRSGSPVR